MITVELLDIKNKKAVNEFVQFPFEIYKNIPQWVPPILSDIKVMIDPAKHPFYEHSDGQCFVARRDGRMVGRICAMENKPFNAYHDTHIAQFYLFECVDDQEVANALFERIFQWARERGLNEVVGPKGFSLFDGYGIQIEGFEHRQMMTMMNYNPEYYVRLVETLGFQKEVDFVSCYIPAASFKLPEKVHLVAQKVLEKGKFTVKTFQTTKELKTWADRIGEAYNNTFINNWEYYPQTKKEIDYTLNTLLTVADPRLIKIVLYEEKVVGFLLGFPDLSAALQRAKGRLTPWSIIDLIINSKRTNWVSLNGAGMLPEYQGFGGNALMYAEMDKTIHGYNFEHYELTQVAESAVQMRKDLITMGGKAYKNHRVYFKHI
ncbi:MAG: GNAT family N-acetyltransferase [Bellilinea sp.]